MRAALLPLAFAAVGAQCIVTIAGPLALPGSPATTQQLTQPCGIVSDGASGWYFTDLGANTIQRVWANGTATIAMGITRASSTTAPGDGGCGRAGATTPKRRSYVQSTCLLAFSKQCCNGDVHEHPK